jgi:hypothetical protein
VKRYILAGVAVIFAAALFLATRSEALADALGYVRVFTFTCTTTAQQIKPTSGRTGSRSIRLWNNSATSVFLGASDVATTSTGYPICTNTANCESSGITLDANPVVYCRVAAATQDILVFQGF